MPTPMDQPSAAPVKDHSLEAMAKAAAVGAVTEVMDEFLKRMPSKQKAVLNGEQLLSSGDMLDREKDGQKLTMVNGDVVKTNLDGSLDMRIKSGNEKVDVQVKGGEIIVKSPNEKEQHYNAEQGVKLKGGVSVKQDSNCHTMLTYPDGVKVELDEKGVLAIERGNAIESFSRVAKE